ncbi:MAG: DUF58 domain-containing protein [Catalinimonas sp.]
MHEEIRDLIQKLRKYEIVIRKALNLQMQGDYHSVFKGTGLEFDDVRTYQYGDDVRTIDWNVTAKGQGTFVKTFREEKEQTVFFIVDVSASQEVGRRERRKQDVSKEICGVLTLAAVKEASQVGVVCFSDDKEKYVRPGKGLKHAYEVIYTLFSLKPKSRRTDLSKAMGYVINLLRRRSIVILVSDFIDENYEDRLRMLARRHDLVVIHVADPREHRFPRLGILPIYDKERGRTRWVNTSSRTFARKLDERFADNRAALEQICKRYQANYLYVGTEEDYVPALIRLFKVRNRGRRQG